MLATRAEPVPPLPTELPVSSYYLQGTDRVRLDQVALQVARHLDPEFIWLDVEEREELAEQRPVELEELLGTGHLRPIAAPGKVRGNDPAANHAFWSFIRPDEDDEVIARVTDYLRLPEVLQSLVAELGESERPRALVLANIERLTTLTDLGPSYFRSVNRALNRAGVTTIATEVGHGAATRYGFDFELVATPDDESRPPAQSLVCVRGGREDCLIFRGFPRSMIACRREVGPDGYGPFEACATLAARWSVVPTRPASLRSAADHDLPPVVY